MRGQDMDHDRIPFFPSESKKKANDMLLAKKCIDSIDLSLRRTEESLCKIEENLDLYSGRWPQVSGAGHGLRMELGGETIMLGGGEYRHYPFIEKIAKTIVADLISGSVRPSIKDWSPIARTEREKVQVDRIKQYFQQNVIQPHRQKVSRQVMQRLGVDDPFALELEQQDQLNNEINKVTEETLGDEIKEFMERYRTPSEMLATQIMDYFLREEEVESKLYNGAKYAVATAEEYYRITLNNNLPVFENLNVKGVSWSGGENVEFVEEGDVAKYEEYITPMQFIQRHGLELGARDYEYLNKYFHPIPGEYSKDDSAQNISHTTVEFLEGMAEGKIPLSGDDLKTKAGHQKMAAFFAQRGQKGGYGIRSVYCTWKWTKPLKKVWRSINGTIRVFLRDSHYVKNPLKGDIKVKKIYIPQVWEGYKYGTGDDWYVGVRPVPYQYTSLSNPTDVKLTIFGTCYGTVDNNTKATSHIDLGKPIQYRIDCLIQKMEEYEKTDIGKVLLGSINMKPDKWTWQEWYESMFKAKMALVQTKGQSNNFDNQVFRAVDLSRSNDIAGTIAQLDYWENKLISAMHSSPAKFGSIGQYATNQVAQATLTGTDRQNFVFAEKRRKMKERLFNALLHTGLVAVKENPDLKEQILDDFTRAHFEVNFDVLETSRLKVTVEDNLEEAQNIAETKQLALTFLQNQVPASAIAKIRQARSVAEIIDIMTAAEAKQDRKEQAAFQQQQQLEEARMAAAQQQFELNKQAQEMKDQRDAELKIALAEINVRQMQLANDVNEDRQPDSVQKAIVDGEVKLEIERLRAQSKKELLAASGNSK